jgi:hypothetical protein
MLTSDERLSVKGAGGSVQIPRKTDMFNLTHDAASTSVSSLGAPLDVGERLGALFTDASSDLALGDVLNERSERAGQWLGQRSL